MLNVNNIMKKVVLVSLVVLVLCIDGYSGVLLQWTPPTTRINSTPITGNLHYKVYWGTSSRNYDYSLDVGGVNAYYFTAIPAGTTFYFAVTALEDTMSEGIVPVTSESVYSNEVTRTIEIDEVAPEAPPSFTCVKLFIGKVYCSWADVAVNEDETAVEDLLKYRIYYGADRNAPEHYVDVESGLDYMFDALPLGEKNYFKAVAIDTSNNNSVYTTEFTEKVNAYRNNFSSGGWN